MPASAQACPDVPPKKFGAVARVLWPRKTATELAFRAGISERAAKYYLSGDRDPSRAAIAAVIAAMLE